MKKQTIKQLKNLYFWTFFILGIMTMVIPVSAESTAKQNNPISLIQTCNNCTYCNITKILNPNKVVFFNNLNMTKDGSSYNFTLNSTYTNQIGVYEWYYDCGNGIDSSTGILTFEITPTGYSNNLVLFYIIMFLFPWGLFLLGLWKRDMTIAILGTIGFYLIALYLLLYGINGTKDMLSNGIGIIHLGIAFYTSIRYTLESIDINW